MCKPPLLNKIPANESPDRRWYVAYTFPKSEQKVQKTLERMGVESYLPLQYVVRRWSDRNRALRVPLFPNYLFINASLKERSMTFSVREIVKYVSFGGKPATVTDSVIDSLRIILRTPCSSYVEGCINMGSPVKIACGPFAGIEGVVLRRHGKYRLVVEINALKRSVAVDLPMSDILPMTMVISA